MSKQGSAAGGYGHAFERDEYVFDPAVHLLADSSLFEGLLEAVGAGGAGGLNNRRLVG